MIHRLIAAAALAAFAAPALAAQPCPPNDKWQPYSDSQTQTETVTFQGYSWQPQKTPGGQGTSSITRTTTTATTGYRNPQNQGQGCILGSQSDVSYVFAGPGNSPAEELLADRVELVFD